MLAIYNFTELTDILEQIQSPGCAQLIRQIDLRLKSSGGSHILEILYGYEEVFVGAARALRQNGKLVDTDYSMLRNLFLNVQASLYEKTAVDVPVDARYEDAIEALYLLGGIDRGTDKYTVSLFLNPRMLTQAFSIASLLESPSRAKHIKAISGIRGIPMSLEEAREIETRYIKRFADALREILREHAKRVIPATWHASTLANLSVELLPTATDFYEAGIDYYSTPEGHGHQHYIFATTSGILLPQDYYGSAYFEKILPVRKLFEDTDKNPKREDYFKALADVRGRPRSYYFEITRAGRAFQKTINTLKNEMGEVAAESYRLHSKSIIAKFLQLQGFGLIGVDHFPPEYDYLTLGNGRHLFLSGRDKEERKEKIGHGLWVRTTGKSIRGFANEFKELNLAEWLASFIAAAGMSVVEDDPRLQLLEALISGFAVPFILAGRRYWSKQHAQDTFLDIGKHISKTIAGVNFPFKWPSNRRPIGEAQAMREAERVVLCLESVV